MTDIARLVAVADLIGDDEHGDRAAIARSVARTVARLTRAGSATVVLTGPSGSVLEAYPPASTEARGDHPLEAEVKAASTTGWIRVSDPADGAFDEADAWLLSLAARRVAGQLASLEVQERARDGFAYRAEVQAAGEVQRSLAASQRVQRDAVRGAGVLVPARGVSGDMFDLIECRDGVIAVLADVSGKGPAASMLTGAIHAAVQQHAPGCDGDPARLLVRLSESLDGMLTRSGRIVTVAIVAVDADGSRARVASAGHHIVAIRDAVATTLVEPTAPPLGVTAPSAAVRDIALRGDAAIVLASDGLVEQRDGDGAQFGTEGLRAAIDGSCLPEPEDLVSVLLAAVRRHAGGAPQDDDQSVVVLRTCGGAA